MAFLFHDIVLDDTAFKTASDDMASLKQQAANLKTKLEKMYEDVTSALDTSAGDEIQFTAKNVLLQPIEDIQCFYFFQVYSLLQKPWFYPCSDFRSKL